MAKLRIAIAHGPDDAPRLRRRQQGRRRALSDVEKVADVLGRGGHDVFFLGVDGTTRGLRRLTSVRTDLLFNLVEGFGGDDTKEPHVAAYYDLLGLRYTGSGPRGLAIAMDKVMTKKILAFHGIRTPQFVNVFRGRLDWAHDLEFPVIVKPAREDGSIGIGFGALVGSIKELMERIDALHADFNHPVLIEQYIEGREIYVGILGNAAPEPFPPVELDLSHLPAGTPRIAGTEVKWQEGTRAYRGSRTRVPTDVPADLVEKLQAAALTAFQTLQLRDYARVDFRLAGDGTPYLIEVNPNPYLHPTSEFIQGARATGRTYATTIRAIVELALARYGVGV
jgi:D-alanine-D-alanine ligase